jgi:16S rRNA (guanine527-N7)-methyltransferase
LSSGLSPSLSDMLLQGVEQMGLNIAQNSLESVELYLAEVLKWRSRINLVSLANERELISHHALDSLALLPLMDASAQILDFGTGAGFPGMPLAAARPDLKFCLLDSRRRRIEFLRLTGVRSGLKNTNYVCSRVEAFVSSSKLGSAAHSQVRSLAKFDTLVVRAVASLEQLVSMTRPLHDTGVRLIAMKGRYPHTELEKLESKHSAKFATVRVEPLAVPFLDAERHAVTIEF